ncbi:phospholipase/carboxylesterase [Rhizomicrobium palustre]|uniref:Phospholipase/carboxylesterase n=1 Tax=Rhizomicrobium palustre TaxID=189966 RepID=A0A846MX07_9PROT|nr:dienelactone hydrolase family protein [Rhizomicrobium palustre]NIK88088.1 phospholipase/carboxylesterase [Rhizomicrobium palustre]
MALSGPRIAPKRGKATELVILVHGYGADGEDLIELAEPLSQALPGAAFVAPNAPTPCPGARFMWFPITDLNPRSMHAGVTAAAPVLKTAIEAELSRLSLGVDRLALIGFSQGTMLALNLILTGLKPAAVVGFSGVLTGMDAAPADLPPIFLAHGSADEVIPVDALFMTAGALGARGARVQWHLTEGLGHGIDGHGLNLAGQFLASAFAGTLAAEGPASSVLR